MLIQILNSFGYNTVISQLLTVPPYVCGGMHPQNHSTRTTSADLMCNTK